MTALDQPAVPRVPAARPAEPAISAEPTTRAFESSVWSALADVADPEIPTVSIVDLGMVGRVEAAPERVRVEILPTFVGCPAIDAIRTAVSDRLAGMAPVVEVDITFVEPWTTERITFDGRRKLRESGFAPPTGAGGMVGLVPLLPVARCPYCASRRTVLENAFGPTACRAIHYCTDCRQPFEAFKPV